MPPSFHSDMQTDMGASSPAAANVTSDASFMPAQKLDIGAPGVFEIPFGTRQPRKSMRVNYYLPTCWTISTPVLFVLHGVRRDADKYFSKMLKKDLPQSYGFTLLCPEFSRSNFPSRASYNSGNIYRQENTSRKNQRLDWGFSAIESIFDQYINVTASTEDGYFLYGHSAGAQFVHRHVAFMGSGGHRLRVKQAVAANAGFYTVPTFDVPFPFGFGGTEGTFNVEDMREFLKAPLSIVLGEKDNDSHHHHLNRSDRAMVQGPHRLARGQHFYQAGVAKARELEVQLGWSLHFVPGVGHSDSRMSRASIQYLFHDRQPGVCSIWRVAPTLDQDRGEEESPAAASCAGGGSSGRGGGCAAGAAGSCGGGGGSSCAAAAATAKAGELSESSASSSLSSEAEGGDETGTEGEKQRRPSAL